MSDRRRLRRMPWRFVAASTVGAVAGFAVVLFLLSATQMWPGSRHFSDDFFDAQTRSWLSGRWDVPIEVVGGEGFSTDTGTQIYFGITPSLLRVPVLAVTDRFDGKLTQLSEMLALGVIAAVTSRLMWTARTLLAPDDDGDSWYAAATGGLLVALVAGCSSATFLAAQSTVFGEATLWSVALALASADQLARFLLVPSMRRAIAAAALAGLSLNTRLTVGVGAMVPVALVAVIALLSARPRFDRLGATLVPDARSVRRFGIPILAVLGLFVAINFGANAARFGHPWKIPYERQILFRVDKDRLALYQESSGPFSPGYFVTDVVGYLRPDGIRVAPFPAVSFRDTRETFIRIQPPNIVEPTASLPSAMPGLFLLAVVGGVTLTRRVADRRARVLAFRAPVLGGAIGALFLLNYTSLAHRYTGDFLPLLVVLGALGAARASVLPSRVPRAIVAGGLTVLCLWGAWVTVGLTMWLNENNSMRTRDALASWVSTLVDIEARVSSGPVVSRPPSPPAVASGWDVIARPDCARVYVATLRGWYAFEQAPGSGAFHLRVEPPPDDGATHPLVGTEDGVARVGLRRIGDVVSLEHTTDGGVTWSPAYSGRRVAADDGPLRLPLPVGEDGRVDLVVDFDWYLGKVTASGDDADTSLILLAPLERPEQPVVLATDYPGDVDEVTDRALRCPDWTASG